MKKITLVLFISIISATFFSCTSSRNKNINENLIYGGSRSSHYGIKPFPDQNEWQESLKFIQSETNAQNPAAIWIVGVISNMRGQSFCRLNFPSDGNEYENISFSTIDENEEYLNSFDEKGIKVFLQVEPGNADVEILIRLIMNQYNHHPCVVGFGVDSEWYKVRGTDGWGTPISDTTAELWETSLKNFNPDYQLFLKHWDAEWMPSLYRGDLIFVNDSQGFNSLSQMRNEFNSWAQTFNPNMVFFQVGYEADKPLWSTLDSPVTNLCERLGENVMQNYGFFWVDFTLRQVTN